MQSRLFDLYHCKIQIVFLQAACSLFDPHPSSIQGERNGTAISIRVPVDAGANLETVVLNQHTNLHQLDWGNGAILVYKGGYVLRAGPSSGHATSLFSNERMS